MAIDYRSFSKDGALDNGSLLSKRWWDQSDDDMPAAIAAVVNSLAQADSRRQTQYQTSVRLYGNMALMGVNGLSYAKVTNSQAPSRDRISYNVVQSAIDTVVAKMSKNKPKPLFLTSGGNWKLQKRAKNLDKFVDGIFYENKAYVLGLNGLRDGGIVGDGVVQVMEQNGRVKFERVLASEMYVDQVESFYGYPRQLHRAKNVDRSVLIDRFPSKKAFLQNTKNAVADAVGLSQNTSDQVTVVESWHLPSGPNATDGVHVITVEGTILYKEDWKKSYFPFAFFKWAPRMYGFWAQGAAEQIQNTQLEINKILWVIQRSMHLGGSFKIFVENGSKIVKEHFSNDFGAIINYTGTAPTYVTPPIVPPEIYQHLQTLKNQAFEQVGVSQLSAAAKKPAGLDSGKALREMNDIESDRFQVIGQAYEEFYLDLAKLAIGVAKEIYERDGKYSVNTPGKKFLETIDWKDIKLEDDEYVMKCFPISSLPQDPAGRLQTITEYMQAGFITPRVGRRLLDFPDLEQAEVLGNSREDWLHEVFDKMIEDGEAYQLEPEDDAQLAHELALDYIAYAKVCKVDEDRIQLLRDFINDVVAKTSPPMGPGGGGVAAPQAVPTAPPVSDMLPNAQGAAA